MSVEIIQSMLELQNSFNTKVHNDWKNQNFKWDIAVWVECGEMMDHLGYKWWKKQAADKDQVILEMVDIWHFGMSYIMNSDAASLDVLSHYLHMNYDKALQTEFNENDFKKLTNTLVNKITDELPWFASTIFFKMWKMLGKDMDDLYKMYIGKNALNEFRQRNGYKEGTYIKNWNGSEDNEVLTKLMGTASVHPDLYNEIFNALDACYASIKLGQ
jgi:dimeric dUTPase (all-alpha-NTP-PPase superfamily)